MKIRSLSKKVYEIDLIQDKKRSGIILTLTDDKGKIGVGEIAPLPGFSKETLMQAKLELSNKEQEILSIDWTKENCLEKIVDLNLLPSVAFGLESVLLSLLDPLPVHTFRSTALLAGSVEEILSQAERRKKEGYRFAKLKVGNLRFDEAKKVIDALKHMFCLRIDVNRSWQTEDSLRFFSGYQPDTFDYVEEPFSDPKDLCLFPLPFAVDESFPIDLSLFDLQSLRRLKAIIYKPTIQGGLAFALPLKAFADQQGIDFILSSSFESDIGLSKIVSMAHRMQLKSPIGIGTYVFLKEYLSEGLICFSDDVVHVLS